MLLLALTSVILMFVLFLLWFFLLTDRDCTLAIAERFGRPVSAYRREVIWITGASSGLGEAIAYELASVGAKLVLSARNQTLLEGVKNKCLEISQGDLTSQDVLVVPLDVADHKAHQARVKAVLDHFGKVDVLIANAGKAHLGPAVDTELEDMKDLFAVNFFGNIRLTKHILRHFQERRKGQIVVISSSSGKSTSPGLSTYSASKHAINAYYETVRMEHYKDGIHVSIICPGPFDSNIFFNIPSTKKGETLDVLLTDKMTTNRAAHLTLVAAANQIYEAWIAHQPFLLLTFCSHYVPQITMRFVLDMVFTAERIEDIYKGLQPRGLLFWKPISW